jgi:haloalkane dehalogenase
MNSWKHVKILTRSTSHTDNMKIFLIIILALIGIGTALIAWNHYDVQARGNGANFNPDIKVLRTPDSQFDALTDFPFEPHYIEIQDEDLGALRVHYLDEGPRDGHVITLLHGQATWSYSYRKMIPILVDAGYRVIVPDLVGFGRSDKPADWKAHTFQKQVEWLEASLQQLDVKGSTGFLFDWGGYFGLRALVDDPDLFNGVVLCTTTVPQGNSMVGTLWVQGWRRYILKPEIFPISGMVAEMIGGELDAQSVIGLDAPYPDERYKGGPRRMPMMIPATGMHPAAAPNRAAWEELKNWDKPAVTLIAESLSERGFPPKEFHDQMPGTADQPHEIYPDTGFFLIEDIPEKLAEKTLEFVALNNLQG